MTRLIYALGFVVMLACGSSQPDPYTSAVARSLGSNKLGISADDLKSKKDPKGEGYFVYVEQTRFSGVERYILWLVLDDKAYPLNGATEGAILQTSHGLEKSRNSHRFALNVALPERRSKRT